MSRSVFPFSCKSTLTVGALVVSTALAYPFQPPRPGADRDPPAKGSVADAQEAIRREAEKAVSEITLEVFSEGKWAKVERIEKPLLYYGDHTRHNDRGSLWAWGRKGRPVALLELFQGVINREKWAFAICNTSGRKLRATRAGLPWWRENDSASELADIPGAPAPSAEAPGRQRQLKLLARKFTGHEFWDPGNSRYELRRLARPLYTYRDEAGGVLEGGLFTLANGTNPEILLFVEARTDPKDRKKAVWQFTVGRLAHAELHLEYDGKEVFNAPRGNRLSAPDKPY
ncbi:MAG TPA: hypothetical protein VE173_05695, partial [Longimicrobiales bacterium]|nr:hypothetical protein [Longimicrobiales bacterium]